MPPDAMFDEAAACNVVSGDQFIFDVQTHWFSSEDTKRFPPSVLSQFGPLFILANENAYINSMFLQSDDDRERAHVVAGYPCPDDPANMDPCGLPLSNESMVASRDKINALAFTHTTRRSAFSSAAQRRHRRRQAERADDQAVLRERGAAGWKMYPGFNAASIDPRGSAGYFLDEPESRQIIEHGLALGQNRFASTKVCRSGASSRNSTTIRAKSASSPRPIPRRTSSFTTPAFAPGSTRPTPPRQRGPMTRDDPDPVGVNATHPLAHRQRNRSPTKTCTPRSAAPSTR